VSFSKNVGSKYYYPGQVKERYQSLLSRMTNLPSTFHPDPAIAGEGFFWTLHNIPRHLESIINYYKSLIISIAQHVKI